MTMYFAIQTFDKPGHAQLRLDARAEHVAYLKANARRLVAAGGLLDDAGGNGAGGILLIEAEDRADAERFAAEDPFTKVGLFQSVTVTRWRKAFFDGECLL